MRLFILLAILFFISDAVECLEIDSFLKYLNEENNASSSECDTQKVAFLTGILQQELWALQSKLLHKFFKSC